MFINNMNKLPVIHENGTLYRVKNKGRASANTITVENAVLPKVTVSSMTPRPMFTGNTLDSESYLNIFRVVSVCPCSSKITLIINLPIFTRVSES